MTDTNTTKRLMERHRARAERCRNTRLGIGHPRQGHAVRAAAHAEPLHIETVEALEALQARVVELEEEKGVLEKRLAWTTGADVVDGPLKGLFIITSGNGRFFDVHRPDDQGNVFQNGCRYELKEIGTHGAHEIWQCGEEANSDAEEATIARLREALSLAIWNGETPNDMSDPTWVVKAREALAREPKEKTDG